jgi:uncharacterized protein YdaU (DUF1376 family)
MFFYQFNIKDFHYDTGHLDLVTEGTYRRLIDFAYETEAPIADISYTSRRIRCEESVVTAVLEEFFQQTEEGWVHTRIQKEVAAYQQLKQKGKVAAAKRWNGSGMGNPSPTQCQTDAPPMPTKNQEPINQEPVKKTVAVKPQPTPKLSDEEWLESLKPNYPHIDIEQESRKMDAWLSTRRGKQKTRRFVVNWLNRIDAPMQPATVSSPFAHAF